MEYITGGLTKVFEAKKRELYMRKKRFECEKAGRRTQAAAKAGNVDAGDDGRETGEPIRACAEGDC